MSGPTRLESKASFLSQKLRDRGISAASILETMLEWNALPSHEKASYRLPADPSWSAEELEILRRLWSSGALPEEVLEALPERSYAAITHKAHREGIRRPEQYIKAACRQSRLNGRQAR